MTQYCLQEYNCTKIKCCIPTEFESTVKNVLLSISADCNNFVSYGIENKQWNSSFVNGGTI